MLKKEKLVGKYFIYTVFDKIAKRYQGTFYHTTDEDMIRITLPSILLDFALRDIDVVRIGVFNDVTGEVKSIPHKKVNVHCYTFPHSRLSSDGDDLSLEDIDKNMKAKKVEMVVNRSKANDKEGEEIE